MALGLAAILAVAGCNDQGPWTAIIFREHSNPASADRIRGFATLDLCRKAAREKVDELGPEHAWYQCGHSCARRQQYGGAEFCAKVSK